MPLSDDSRASSRYTISSASLAETIFLGIIIVATAGPVSGMISWAHSSLSSIISKGSTEFESTRNLASQLIDAGDKIKTLEKKIADSELELTKLRQEAKDVNKLRSLLNLKQSINRHTIGADVTARGPDNWYERVIIDKGSRNNVQMGSAVITSQGVVGQIVKVEESTSVVRLVTDPELKMGVVIQRINLPGVLRGNFKNPAVIEYIPVGSAVDIGDKVTCLGNGGIFPPGHPVGTVSMVRRDTNGTTLSIEVRLSENLYDLTHVLIVPPISI